MNYINKILFLIGYKYYLIVVYLSLFILISLFEIISLSIITPFLSAIVNSEVANNSFINIFISFDDFSQKNLIIFFGILIFSLLVIKSITTIFCWYLVYFFSWKNVISIRSNLVDIYKDIDYEKYLEKTSSEYIQNVTVLPNIFIRRTLVPAIQILSDSFLTLFIAAFLLFTDIYIFLSLAFVLILTTVLFSFFLKQRLIYYGEQLNKSAVAVLSGVKNIFHGYKEVKIYNKSDYFKKNILNGTKDNAKFNIRFNIINLLPKSILEILIAFITVIFIFIFFVVNSYSFEVIIPKLVVFVVAAMRIGPAVASINNCLNLIKLGKFQTEKLYSELKYQKNKTEYYAENYSLKKFKSISFDNVSYCYPGNNNYALENVSFNISQGEIIGISGDSGAGKTTCIDLLLGFLRPSKGEIKYNENVVIKNNNIDKFQEKIGYIPQDIFIVNDTIRNNIIFDNENKFDDVLLDMALTTSNLHKFINSLQKGNNTFLSESGFNISGGQKQRISIARALYHNREILILDESTNALDEKTERNIIDEINLMKKFKTIIIISHNYKILDICDKIIVFNEGKIKQIDTYKNILH